MRFLVTFLSALIVFSLGTLAKQYSLKCGIELTPTVNQILYPSFIKPIFSWNPSFVHPTIIDSDYHFWTSSSSSSSSSSTGVYEDALIKFTNIRISGGSNCQCKLVFLNPAHRVIKAGGTPILDVWKVDDATEGSMWEPEGNHQHQGQLNLDKSRAALEEKGKEKVEEKVIPCQTDMTFRVGIRVSENSPNARYVSFYQSNSFLRWGQPPAGWVLEQSCVT